VEARSLAIADAMRAFQSTGCVPVAIISTAGTLAINAPCRALGIPSSSAAHPRRGDRN
jgi:hypothetical protein